MGPADCISIIRETRHCTVVPDHSTTDSDSGFTASHCAVFVETLRKCAQHFRGVAGALPADYKATARKCSYVRENLTFESRRINRKIISQRFALGIQALLANRCAAGVEALAPDSSTALIPTCPGDDKTTVGKRGNIRLVCIPGRVGRTNTDFATCWLTAGTLSSVL